MVADLFTHVLYAFYLLLVVLVPLSLFYVFAKMWVKYVRTNFEHGQPKVLLELKLPKEITKSPAAMEVFFTALYQTGATSLTELYWLGKGRPTFSLEMVSLQGQVKFFIWTQNRFRRIVEAQIYAQYPNVEIFESPDYTEMIEHGEHLDMWGTYFIKKQKDVYPIKTYLDYGLDDNPKEEHKVDPMTSVMEYLGSLGQNEYGWIQILIQAHKEEGIKEGRVLQFRRGHWKEEVKEEIEHIKETVFEGDTENQGFQRLTKGQQDLIAAMERNMHKYPFETCIRGFYFGPRDNFNANLGITGLIGTFRQYSSPNMNEIALGWFTDHKDLGKDINQLFGWIPFFGRAMRRRRDKMERHMLELYKEREGFELHHSTHAGVFIMTTEELATVFHFPGDVAATPTFDRILAKKAQAPSNLPI